ncbi:MAG: helix-turn-helix transcriptional regulator [Planctomycetes bacterium]|nr:helix-turn-helix transcriptional regulator [Planctomycetota bacterium]
MSHENIFGKRLRQLRKAKNLTQRELAERVAARLQRKEHRGFDFTYLSKIENGKTPPPSVAVIQQLAKVLEADAYELITLAGKVPPNLGETLRENEAARAFYRSAFDVDLKDEDWRELLEELKRRKGNP